MAIAYAELLALLQQAFPKGEVVLEALVDDGDHYAVTITDAQFDGLSRVRQHQLVGTALGGRLGEQLHALSIKTVGSKAVPI
jgi:stress-induced morphogen